MKCLNCGKKVEKCSLCKYEFDDGGELVCLDIIHLGEHIHVDCYEFPTKSVVVD